MTDAIRPIAAQGVHHITLKGADRRSCIACWEGVLGMPFVFEQPNRDTPAESHLYLDPGDGRLVTVFADDTRAADPAAVPEEVGAVHHLAFAVSPATFAQVPARLDAHGIAHSGPVDRGFMDSLYLCDPLGLRLELAVWRLAPPAGLRRADMLILAHRARVREGAFATEMRHVAHALETLALSRDSLSRCT